ncbi:MAG: GAF domain-containing protein, partial [Chloroflexi bacterium]
MLKLGDFFHLPQVDEYFEKLVADRSGLVVIAGFDPRVTTAEAGFLPSGHTTIFRILMREIWASRPTSHSVVITGDSAAIRVPREFRQQVEIMPVQPPYTYASRIEEAVRRHPDCMVIDRLITDNIPAALQAAQSGIRVLSLLDTVFRGSDVVHYLLDLGAAADLLNGLAWVITVQRLPALCPHCKHPIALLPDHHKRLRARFEDFDEILVASGADAAGFFQPGACEHCEQTGRQGDVMILDVFHADRESGTGLFEQASVFPADKYVLHMAQHGYLSLQDMIHFESDQFRRTYNLFIANERALRETNATLERKVVELETAYHVLQQRTGALFSLQEMGQALISSSDLDDLAAQACRHARELCGADRAILYYVRSDDQTEVLAVGGWDPALMHRVLDTESLFSIGAESESRPYNRLPPGLPLDTKYGGLRAGLYVPLIAQQQRVGAMIVHSTQKVSFAPGEVALLQTFANQAALAIQRAGLIEQLRAKIAALEAAQAELARKERFERELELARQVQQSMLPRTFPHVAGYQFAARNEPARQVGGDFYDVIPLGDEAFGIAVADVSDKGMPAA